MEKLGLTYRAGFFLISWLCQQLQHWFLKVDQQLFVSYEINVNEKINYEMVSVYSCYLTVQGQI